MLKILRVVTLILTFAVVGTFWGTWLGISPSMLSFDYLTYFHIQRAAIANLRPIMQVLMPVTTICMLVALVLLRNMTRTVFFLTLIAFILFCIASAITILGELPLNNTVASWKINTIPANWMEVRAQWEMYHTWRTIAGLGALFSLFIASFTPLSKR